MLALGIHTATEETSLALVRDGVLLGEFLSTETRGQAQFLVPEIKKLLAEHKVSFDDLDLFSVTTGPGSFTGIRIGLSMARGLALASGKPLMGVNSFDVYARAVQDSLKKGQKLLVVANSFRQELFFQLFDEDAQPQGDISNVKPDEYVLEDRRTAVTGFLNESIKVAFEGADFIGKSGVNLAYFAVLETVSKYKPEQVESVKPFYVRSPDVSLPNKETRKN